MASLVHSVLISACAAVIVVEVACRSPLLGLFRTLMRGTRKALRLLTNASVSDHWKERVLPSYAVRILAASLQILAWLVGLLVLFTGALMAGAYGFGEAAGPLGVLQRTDYMIASLIIAVIYFYLRAYLRNTRRHA